MEGLGVKQNFELAIKLYERAANSPTKIKRFNSEIDNIGVAEAQHSLGLIYSNGIYVPKNELIAIKWYEKAVNNGNGNAANNLATYYWYGIAIEQDFQKAEKLLHKANQKGIENAKINLVDLYLDMKFPENALIWYNKCVEQNSLLLISFDLDRLQLINDLIQDFEKTGIQIWEKENKLSSNNMNQFQRCDRFANFNKIKFGYKNLMQEIDDNEPKIKNPFIKKDFDENLVTKLADKGSKTAQIILDSWNFSKKASLCIEKEGNIYYENFILNYSNSIKLESSLLDLNDIMKVSSIINSILFKKEKNALDQNARLCYIFINFQNYEENLSFIETSLLIYPNNKYFLLMKGKTLAFLIKYKESINSLEKLLTLDPDNIDALYQKALNLKYLEFNEESVYEFKSLIQKIQNDNKYYPSILYYLSYLSLIKGENYISREYYNKGKESEKNQLPIYLPYESNVKKFLEMELENKTFEKKSIEYDYESDIMRINIILDHRNFFYQMKKKFINANPNFVTITTTQAPRLENKNIKFDKNSKQIYFREIDASKDYVFTNRFLIVKIIDVPIFGMQSIGFLIQDENIDSQRLSIYNLGENYDEIQKTYHIGCQFEIYNPYMRIANDGNPRIRIDDPKTIRIINNGNNNCRVCLTENCKLLCSKCKIAFYCSKKCQNFDWKTLKHKLICQSN